MRLARGTAMSLTRTLALSLLVGLVAPTAARADGLFVPFIGVNFGGNSGRALSAAIDAERLDWGMSLAYMGGGVLGLEADLANSPDFYGKTDLGGSNAFTATGNVLVGIPFGGQHGFGVRPYGVVGTGLLRSKSDFGTDVAEIDENDLTWSAGGGVLMFFGSNAGLRFDVRYFRTFDDLEILGVPIAQSPGKVDFTRGSLGFVFRF